MDLVALRYSYSRIIHDYYVKNWKDEKGSSKVTIARKAVLDYHDSTEIQKNVDPVFKIPDDEADYEGGARNCRRQSPPCRTALPNWNTSCKSARSKS